MPILDDLTMRAAALGGLAPLLLYVGLGALSLAVPLVGYLVVSANEEKRTTLPILVIAALAMFGGVTLSVIYLNGREDGPSIALRNASKLLDGKWAANAERCTAALDFHVYATSKELVVRGANLPARYFGIGVVDEPGARVDLRDTTSGSPVAFLRKGDRLEEIASPGAGFGPLIRCQGAA